MTIDARFISLFSAVRVDNVVGAEFGVTLLDITALMGEYRYMPTPELVQALENMTPYQRGSVFERLAKAFASNIDGMSDKVSPLYRDFPNHTIVPLEARIAVWLLRALGANLEFDPRQYGADPITGFQTDLHGGDIDLDGEYTLEFKADRGNARRKMRFLKPMTHADIEDKTTAMLSNLTPFTPAELDFVKWALASNFVDDMVIRNIKFREKLPLVAAGLPADVYASFCNSVTDALRLAVHLSGTQVVPKMGTGWRSHLVSNVTVEPDLSLNTPPRFKLNRAEARKVMMIVDGILERGNTDYQTDFMRNAEFWKRFARHVTSSKYDKSAPRAAQALARLRNGDMKSWEQRYAAADTRTKIDMAAQRPGEFARRLTALTRGVNKDGTGRNALISAARAALPEVNAMTLMQLRTHVNKTMGQTTRVHALPNGTLMRSERGVEGVPLTLRTDLERHLSDRLAGTLPFNRTNIPEEAFGMFVPVGGRAASDSDARTNRGDRVRLSFTDEDTIRFFLHWHEACDVDMSAVAFDGDLNPKFDCAYYNLRDTGMSHSGDILDGRNGAAEYIDIQVGQVKKSGVRYVLMNANVYAGMAFDTFECNVGVMIRDGQTGKHFECSTVETKLSLDSNTRNTTPAILDLETGDMIYLDIPSNWRSHSNVAGHRADLKETLRYFINYDKYRPSFGDIVSLPGSDDPSAPAATLPALRDKQDEILAAMADA